MKIKYKIYKTAESIMEADIGYPLSEISHGTGLNGKGEEVEFGIGQMLEGIKKQGCWGFADKKKKTIHVWFSKKASKGDLLFFLCHELGHIQPRFKNTLFEEEMRANSYGEVCLEAIRQLRKMGVKL